ncbi:MAG TPA: alpha/beta hydrolase [Tepidisphaeraceae bacterium]|nr:alpha/beta hydrolase [Tepidisphaeraceae bacterium]
MTSSPDAFVHRYVPPTDGQRGITLLMLHGTGGNENDLLPMGQSLLPGAGLLSPRGKVLENGMPRFFRRLAEGVFDVDDLRRRTGELADFVPVAAEQYGFDAGRVVAVGYSNGANIAAAMLLLRPGVLAAAALLRPMVPLTPDPLPDLGGTPVLIEAGGMDPIVPAAQTDELANLLQAAGATVTVRWHGQGHQLTQADLATAAEWLGGVDRANG